MKYTRKQFQEDFPTDEACLDKVLEIRFGGHQFDCPGCGVESKFHRITKRRAYACQNCGHHVYPCAGTPFERSRVPLFEWFFVMYLLTSTRHGVAAKEVERQIGCTYKTAWRMCHELRKLMAQADTRDPLSGHVEIDETFIGGRAVKDRREGKKTAVFGMLERQSKIRAGTVPSVGQLTLEPIILTNVVRGSVISTDESRAYNELRNAPYKHGTIVHSRKEWVCGIHHVNSLEGHWSQLKRSIRGTHVHVSSKHLWKYVSEFSYRRNYRQSHAAMFGRLVVSLALPRLAES